MTGSEHKDWFLPESLNDGRRSSKETSANTRLFGLGPRVTRPSARHIAIARKSRAAPDIEAILCREYSAVTGRISAASACGIVLDYDGTLSDRRRRFDPLDAAIGQSLRRAAVTGAMIGIATGRGRSADLALQEILPANTWSRVLMGYYKCPGIGPGVQAYPLPIYCRPVSWTLLKSS